MPLPEMIGMDGDPVDQGPGRPLRADQDPDRIKPEKATMSCSTRPEGRGSTA